MYMIGTENGICSQTAGFWQLVGQLLTIIKIVIPVALIIVGIITLGKAVITTDEKEAKKGFQLLIKKFIVAVFIFFLPTLVTAMFTTVKDFSELRDDYDVCRECIVSPKGDYCNSKVIASTNYSAY